jgi:hypothetical protein
MDSTVAKPFNWTPVALGAAFLVFVGIVVGLVIYFTGPSTPGPAPVQVAPLVQTPARTPAPKSEPSTPPYTNTQSALADRFWCNGPCIT